MTDNPNLQIVADFQGGDDLAFVQLFNLYKHSVYLFSVRMLGGDAESARDVVQNVFLKVYEERDRLRQPERFKAWLFAMARNMCLSLHRRAKFLENDRYDEGAPGPDNVHEDLARAEDARLVSHAITELRPEYREVIILREYQDFSYKEIAEIVGCSESAVKSRIFAARQQLYTVLKPLFEERR